MWWPDPHQNGDSVGILEFFRSAPSDEELKRRAERAEAERAQRAREEEAQRARRERQVRVTKADLSEIQGICEAALRAASLPHGGRIHKADVTEIRLTRGGLVLRGTAIDTVGANYRVVAQKAMRRELIALGFVVEKDFGADGIIVTGWDPEHYEGDQLTVERIDARIEELLQVRRELLALEDDSK